jgi:hypothetical protein
MQEEERGERRQEDCLTRQYISVYRGRRVGGGAGHFQTEGGGSPFSPTLSRGIKYVDPCIISKKTQLSEFRGLNSVQEGEDLAVHGYDVGG